MKRYCVILLCLFFMTTSCAKNPSLPTTEEVKGMILKDIKTNMHKYLLSAEYDDLEIEVSNIKQSRDYDAKTKRVSYRYTASFKAYRNNEVQMEQTVFNTLPLEYVKDIGWRKRTIKIVL